MFPVRVKGGSNLNSGIALSYLPSVQTRVGLASALSGPAVPGCWRMYPDNVIRSQRPLIPFNPNGNALLAFVAAMQREENLISAD